MASLNEKLFDEIMILLEKGDSLSDVLKSSEKYPSRPTFYKFLKDNQERLNKYARATSIRADYLFDQIIEISDNTIEGVVIETDDNGRTKEKKGDMLGHRKLQIDSRKWVLSKMNPKKYGDKIDVTSDDEPIGLEINFVKREKKED